ncbi:endonuclease/exonuclease/phosphatase family protein [Belliella sp. R4-6]|uniref:Endonuclease/exonuclease/phosphatase family protein n=1 Tax=Belliella alkalica TaxID=1730871 RepID=A0ABS9V7Z8_9BACT|nr:endonuclease/exonuclease/phosphatase family protein [Belliella alkalica]MCH7412537.1 endonuclease/exonuclease/phosphatase family protein [Belliella alkalica]
MYYRLFFLNLFLLFSFCSQAQKATELTLMTYNIYHGEDPYNLGKSNLREIADLILEIKPDLVAFQEVDSMTVRTQGFNDGRKLDVVKELGEMTGMQSFFAKAIDYSEGGYGEGLLSRLPVSFKSYSLPIPHGGEGRSMAVAEVELEKSKLLFAGTHFCHEFEENRMAQAMESIRILMDSDSPSILTGDFNFTSEEAAYNVISDHFTDAALDFGDPQLTYSSKDLNTRLDYFWLDKDSDWEIVSVEVFEVAYSDHLPVVIKVKLKD